MAPADVAAAPSAADANPLVQDAVRAVDRSKSGPSNGLPSRGGNSSRSSDSRRPPRSSKPSFIAPTVLATSDVPTNEVVTGLQQDAGPMDQPLGQRPSSCTLAQMRRFIKSRPYVPVHELRRRFLIDGIEDEVSPVLAGQRTLFVGLPPREAQFLADLIRGGEVGCEVLLDPTSPGVVGVYPMRPVARQ